MKHSSPEGFCSVTMMVEGLLSMGVLCREVGEGHLVPSLDSGICCLASPQGRGASWNLAQRTTSLYMSLSPAPLWGSSVTQRADALHCGDERTIQGHSSASCHDLSVRRLFLLDEGLDSADLEEKNLTAFWNPEKIPGRGAQHLVCQLGGYENVSEKLTCDLRGGHGKTDPLDCGVREQDCEGTSDAEGCGSSATETVCDGHDVGPF